MKDVQTHIGQFSVRSNAVAFTVVRCKFKVYHCSKTYESGELAAISHPKPPSAITVRDAGGCWADLVGTFDMEGNLLDTSQEAMKGDSRITEQRAAQSLVDFVEKHGLGPEDMGGRPDINHPD